MLSCQQLGDKSKIVYEKQVSPNSMHFRPNILEMSLFFIDTVRVKHTLAKGSMEILSIHTQERGDILPFIPSEELPQNSDVTSFANGKQSWAGTQTG